MSARVENKRVMLRKPNGDEVLSETQIYLEPCSRVAPGWRVQHQGVRFEVEGVEVAQGFDEPEYVRLFLKALGA